MRDEDVCADYLRDLAFLLKEEALKAKRDKATAADEDALFVRGRALAYYEVVSLMQEQAKSFEIPLEEIRLAGINPDKDLL